MISKRQYLSAILLVLSLVMVAGCTGSTTEKTVKAGDIVTVDYTGWFDDGTIFDTSNETIAQEADIFNPYISYEPIIFTTGSGEIIQGFDDAVIGMKINESRNITLTPEQAYGQYDPSLIQPVPMSTLTAANITPYVNDTLYYNMEPVRVDSIDGNETVYIDFNHPMAGKTLHFMITVRDIQTE
ncbi:peptidylprolyl isomerase [Methanocella sp. CWC-04]|uniref:Peptidyl-prolyl cis-trans isomerase n=1 Tax=Methanooceanicella nereidis TaxID=2052831 RepID=A0AAP2RBG5_9EURY|nr:peptidylprolyl isomerase [Methanocella sp. CWC-04]MCD1294129.1 peptidylprolyl isomerase [Methanocella sp. CWC-04]